VWLPSPTAAARLRTPRSLSPDDLRIPKRCRSSPHRRSMSPESETARGSSANTHLGHRNRRAAVPCWPEIETGGDEGLPPWNPPQIRRRGHRKLAGVSPGRIRRRQRRPAWEDDEFMGRWSQEWLAGWIIVMEPANAWLVVLNLSVWPVWWASSHFSYALRRAYDSLCFKTRLITL
jgi:hypothetical protein